jgi:hypothetical protein
MLGWVYYPVQVIPAFGGLELSEIPSVIWDGEGLTPLLQNCLFTPELQWQPRGPRRLSPPTMHACCTDWWYNPSLLPTGSAGTLCTFAITSETKPGQTTRPECGERASERFPVRYTPCIYSTIQLTMHNVPGILRGNARSLMVRHEHPGPVFHLLRRRLHHLRNGERAFPVDTPSNLAVDPLSYGGNPGVNGVSHRGSQTGNANGRGST